MNIADDTLMNDSSGNELIVTFKGFDFLDNELEESEVILLWIREFIKYVLYVLFNFLLCWKLLLPDFFIDALYDFRGYKKTVISYHPFADLNCAK